MVFPFCSQLEKKFGYCFNIPQINKFRMRVQKRVHCCRRKSSCHEKKRLPQSKLIQTHCRTRLMYSDCDSKSGFNYFYWIYICISLICHPHQLHLLPLVASSKFMPSFNRSMSWSSSPFSMYKHYWSVAIDCDLK